MMRAPSSFAIVVRRRDGSLHVREHAASLPTGPARWPLVRGVVSLVESLRLGGEALRFSAEQAEEDMNEADAAAPARPGNAASAAAEGLKKGALSALTALGYALFLLATHDGDPPDQAPKPAATEPGATPATVTPAVVTPAPGCGVSRSQVNARAT